MTIDEFGAQNDIRKWFRGQLVMKSQRQLGRDLGVAPSVVSRNASRLRRGLRITQTLAMRIKAALE